MTKNTSDKPSKKKPKLFNDSLEAKKMKTLHENCLDLIGPDNDEIKNLFQNFFELSCLNGIMIVHEGLEKGYSKFKTDDKGSSGKVNEQAAQYLNMLIKQVLDGMSKRKWLIENI